MVQETYKTTDRIDKKRNFSQHIVIKTLWVQNKEKHARGKE